MQKKLLMLIEQDMSIDDAFTEVHDQLKRAGVDTRHKFRFFSVATLHSSTSLPQSRMVVLRSFADDWTFEFYTDLRSSKVGELKENQIISALFWDPSKRVQVRIEAKTTLHHGDELAGERWADVQGDAQKAYTSELTPGKKIDSPEEAHHWPDNYTDDHFCVVSCEAKEFKALQISGMEHIAFQGSREGLSDNWKKSWIVP